MKHKIEFASHPGNLSRVRNLVRQFLAGFHFTAKEIDLLVLGVDEACTNIIRHVYQHEVTHLMAFCCEQFEHGVRFRVRDFGAQPQKKFAGRSLEKVQPGGLGMHLIRKAFDQIDYVKKRPGTEIVLTKHFPARINGHVG